MRPPVIEKLSPRHQIFAERMAVTGNGRLSALAAGYSEHTADKQASRLLTVAKVAAEVARQRARRVEAVEIEASEVIATLANIMRTDLRDVMDWDEDGGYVVASFDLPRQASAAVKEVRIIKHEGSARRPAKTETRVILHDKIAAASKLAEMLGMLPDRYGIGGSVHVGDNVQVVMTGPEMLEAVQRVYGLAESTKVDVIEERE